MCMVEAMIKSKCTNWGIDNYSNCIAFMLILLHGYVRMIHNDPILVSIRKGVFR